MLRIVINRLEDWLIAALLAAMTLLTFVQVVLRYVFGGGLLWALEATTYLFAWLILIGISWGIRNGAHIAVDVIVRTLGPGAQRLVGLAAVGLCVLYAGLMLWGSWVYVDRMHLLGVEVEDLPIQRWVLGLALPIGFGLLILRLTTVAWQMLRGERTLITPESEAEAMLKLADRPAVPERGARP